MASSVYLLELFILMLLILSLFYPRAYYASPSMRQICHDEEKAALLHFKESLAINMSTSSDPSAYPKVATWKLGGESGDDCCSWHGVECDKDSGHVVGLNLSSSYLYGSIDSNSSLFHLVELRWLSLADNNFNDSEIPSGIRNLSRLSQLDLSHSGFSGQIPSSLGNLTKLNYLELSSNDFSGKIPPSLVNLLQLSHLSLAFNNFSSGTLHWLCNLVNLTYLRLAQTNTFGDIPSCFRNLTQLTYLKLTNNTITGQLPSWIGNLTQLTNLRLMDNKLHGPIPESISRLQNLENLNLGGNFFSGTFKFDFLPGLKNLSWLQLTDNILSLVYNNNATVTLPKFRLLGLGSCNLLGEFPSFLHGQNNLEVLVLSNNKIEGKIPKWFMSLSTKKLWHLSLSGNLLTYFERPFDVLPWNNLHLLDLSSNNLQGSLPIPPRFISIYDVSKNRISGEIPPIMCTLPSLISLELSNNNLNGKLPQCLSTLSNSTSVLDLRNNSFSGDIPHTFSSGCTLRVIDFCQNKLEGLIPRSLANCTKLEILNLEQNKISDTFPSWLGVLPELRVLILRSNVLHGGMGNPKTNIEFPKLQIVDLSNNSFRGKLPLEYFRNWTSMKRVNEEQLVYMEANISFGTPSYKWTHSYDYTMTMTNKGVMLSYEKIQDSLVAIDLSSNMFEEGVPEVIGDLKALNFLNLSNNFLTGPIPLSLGNLKDLESLDLSKNKFSGEIPMQLEQLTFLAVFNVSHNFLSGPIPRRKQFDTFDNSSYDANSGLCGMPLSRKCGNGEDSVPLAPSTSEEHEESGSLFGFGWKVVAIGYASGFVIGGIIGLFKDTRKCQWLVKSAFARRQQKVPRARRRRSGA